MKKLKKFEELNEEIFGNNINDDIKIFVTFIQKKGFNLTVEWNYSSGVIKLDNQVKFTTDGNSTLSVISSWLAGFIACINKNNK